MDPMTGGDNGCRAALRWRSKTVSLVHGLTQSLSIYRVVDIAASSLMSSPEYIFFLIKFAVLQTPSVYGDLELQLSLGSFPNKFDVNPCTRVLL